MDIATFLVLALATWRFTSLFVREDGPFNMFRKLRESFGITHDENGQVLMVPDRAKLLSCMWCFSMWTGLSWFLFWFLLPQISIYIAFPFSFSAFTILIDGRR